MKTAIANTIRTQSKFNKIYTNIQQTSQHQRAQTKQIMRTKPINKTTTQIGKHQQLGPNKSVIQNNNLST